MKICLKYCNINWHIWFYLLTDIYIYNIVVFLHVRKWMYSNFFPQVENASDYQYLFEDKKKYHLIFNMLLYNL
jgi:hypothetical protein